MLRKFVVLIAAFAAASPETAKTSTGPVDDSATFTVTCFNTNISFKKSLRVTDHQTDVSGKGTAHTEPVQINVNQDATGGSLLINDRNHAICDVTIADHFKMIGGSRAYTANGTANNSAQGDIKGMQDDISLAPLTPTDEGKHMRFEFYGAGPQVGNVTVVLEINYHARSVRTHAKR